MTSALNRESITRYGLDWSRMGVARGIAGSRTPEQEGCFLARDEGEADFFVQMGDSGVGVDVWAVDDIDESALVESPEGFLYLPAVIPPAQLTLVEQMSRRSRGSTRSRGRLSRHRSP